EVGRARARTPDARRRQGQPARCPRIRRLRGRAASRAPAADCAMFMLAANEGIDEPTRTLWRECAEVSMPRVVVVTKLDHARADYDGLLEQARSAFGDKVLPVYLREG